MCSLTVSRVSSFVDPFCYQYFMFIFVMLSWLFLESLWLPAGKSLTSRLSCVWCFLVFCYFPIIEPRHKISNNVIDVTSKASDHPALKRSLIRAFANHLNILWVISYRLNIIWSFYALKEAAQAHLSLHNFFVKMPHCHGLYGFPGQVWYLIV